MFILKSKKIAIKKLVKYIYIPVIGSLFCSRAYSVDLLSVYNDAIVNYPLLKSEYYTAESSYLDIPVARNTAFFPSIWLGATYNYFHLGSKLTATVETFGIDSPSSTGSYRSWSANIKQPVFNYANYQHLSSLKWLADSDFSTYLYQKQTFISQLVQAYFAVIEAQDSLDAAVSNEKYSKMVYKVSQEQYKVGLLTMNDVAQARAPYDISLAQLIYAKNALQLSMLQLSVYTGKTYDKLSVLRDDFPFIAPSESVTRWSNSAKKYNNNLNSSRQLLKSYAYNLSMAKAAYLPVISLSASYKSSNYNYYNDYNIAAIRVSLSNDGIYQVKLGFTWNIFRGMQDFETVKQQAYTYGAQQATTAYQLRDIYVDVNNDYRSINSNASQVKANYKALLAGEEALKQAWAQYKVGVNVCDSSLSSSCNSAGAAPTSPLVNVLEKIQLLTTSQESYVTSKYNYVSSKISLALDAGTLSKKDIIALNYWLTDKKLRLNLYDFPKFKNI